MLNRLVHVATISQDDLPTLTSAGCVGPTWERLEQAASCRPDIVCLPENWARSDGEAFPGAETDKLCAWAREHRCYVVHPVAVFDDGQKYNSAILIDRRGEIQGRYDKIHPTEGEVECGISPGDLDPPVFQTDFGTIGMQICFDVNWPETWRQLKKKGAEIVFYASAYPASRQISTLALLFQFYVVSSTRSRPSTLWDITGDRIDRSGMFRQWAHGTLCLEKRLFEIDNHVGRAHAIEQKYGRRVRIAWYHDEDWFTLDSLDPDVSIPEIMAEFELLPLTDYIHHSTEVQNLARSVPRVSDHDRTGFRI